MQNCVDPCDECAPKSDCHDHGCNCPKCQKVKCKVICEKKKDCCPENPKMCCRISCKEDNGCSKNYQICGDITLKSI